MSLLLRGFRLLRFSVDDTGYCHGSVAYFFSFRQRSGFLEISLGIVLMQDVIITSRLN